MDPVKMVRAKFKCISVTKRLGSVRDPESGNWKDRPTFSYEFDAIVGGSKENDQFFASTPSGSIKLTSVRNDAFEVGKTYYLDFIPAEEAG
jgi:hypothetical protein